MVRKLIKPRSTGAFFIVLLLLGGCFCSKSTISEDEKNAFIKTYADIVLIRIKYDKLDKYYNIAEQAVFEQNSITKEEFQQFEQKISADPELQKEIYEKITEKLKEYREIPVDSLHALVKNLSLTKKDK